MPGPMNVLYSYLVRTVSFTGIIAVWGWGLVSFTQDQDVVNGPNADNDSRRILEASRFLYGQCMSVLSS